MTVSIKGLAETQKAIYEFSEALGDKVTLLALRAGANHSLKAIRHAAPVDTGRLKKAIVLKTSKLNRRRRNGKVGVYIVAKEGARNNKRTALYARWVEKGYKRGKTRVPGKHFIEGAFDRTKQQALDIILTAIEQGGDRLAQEIRGR